MRHEAASFSNHVVEIGEQELINVGKLDMEAFLENSNLYGI
jgi:hypothetical protein